MGGWREIKFRQLAQIAKNHLVPFIVPRSGWPRYGFGDRFALCLNAHTSHKMAPGV